MHEPRPIPQPPLPPIVGAAPAHFVVGAWIVRLHPGAGAWVWPVGRPTDAEATWIDGVDDAEEAVELVEADRRRPLADTPSSPAGQARASRRISASVDGTLAARVRESGLLGQFHDQAIADQLGVSRDVRKMDGIERVPAPTASSAQRERTDALVRDAWGQGLRRDVDIARETGLSEAAVWGAKMRLGLRIGDRKRWTDEDFRLVASFATPQEAADAMGITLQAAKHARRRAAERAAGGTEAS